MEIYRPKSSMLIKADNNKRVALKKTFFIQEKEKGDKYFRSTRVGSCRKIVVKNGIPIAITFKVKNPRGEPLTHFNYTLKQFHKNNSSYFLDYCLKKKRKSFRYG